MRGQAAVVTGGAKGVGRYIAQGLAKEGVRIAIADIDTEPLERTRKELEGLTSDSFSLRADVTNEDEANDLMARAADRFGQIDILVNCAGIVPHFSWGVPKWPVIRDMDKSFWDRIIQTNLGGVFLCTKHVIPYMQKRRSGHILNMHGGGNNVGACAYVVTKDAVQTFSRLVAEEVREYNICVVTVAPEHSVSFDYSPEEARQRVPGVDSLGNRFILAAQAGMELSGKLLTLKDDRLSAMDRW